MFSVQEDYWGSGLWVTGDRVPSYPSSQATQKKAWRSWHLPTKNLNCFHTCLPKECSVPRPIQASYSKPETRSSRMLCPIFPQKCHRVSCMEDPCLKGNRKDQRSLWATVELQLLTSLFLEGPHLPVKAREPTTRAAVNPAAGVFLVYSLSCCTKTFNMIAFLMGTDLPTLLIRSPAHVRSAGPCPCSHGMLPPHCGHTPKHPSHQLPVDYPPWRVNSWWSLVLSPSFPPHFLSL